MSAIFVVLWIVILVGLAGLALQNLSLSISLVFLGLRSQPIPLGFLVLAAIAAGVFTGLVITGLLKLSNYLTQRQPRRTPGAAAPQFQSRQANSGTEAYDQADPTDSWGSESYDEPVNRGYEVEQQPKTTYQSGSTYSYSYRDDKQTGAGRPESVVEADYRVITPPYRSDDVDDDYGFDDEDFEDEDFEDDENFDNKDNPRNPRS